MCFEEGFEGKKKVLIADDDPINRRYLRRILRQEYEIVEAGDGQEALEVLYADPSVEAVLLDLHMPLLDGYELLDVIRRDEKLYQLPVLALTAADTNAVKAQILQAGADDFVIKPVVPIVLMRRLETALLLQGETDQDAAGLLNLLPCAVWLFDAATGRQLYANEKARDGFETAGRISFDVLMESSAGEGCRVTEVRWKGRRAKLVTKETETKETESHCVQILR